MGKISGRKGTQWRRRSNSLFPLTPSHGESQPEAGCLLFGWGHRRCRNTCTRMPLFVHRRRRVASRVQTAPASTAYSRCVGWLVWRTFSKPRLTQEEAKQHGRTEKWRRETLGSGWDFQNKSIDAKPDAGLNTGGLGKLLYPGYASIHFSVVII